MDVKVEIQSQGLEAILKVTGRISESSYTQYIRLAADSRRLVFDTEVDWKELHRCGKPHSPYRYMRKTASMKMQFGYVERSCPPFQSL